MKRRGLCFGVVLLCVFACSAGAADSDNESWYIYWEMGYAKPYYSDTMQNTIDTFKKDPSDTTHVGNMSFNMGALGVYLPVADGTLLGVIVDGCMDRYASDERWMQISQYQCSLSTMRFLGESFFLRGDAGFAKTLFKTDGVAHTTSDWGMGWLLGGGYCHALTRGTRLLLTANYASRQIKDDTYSRFAFNVGGLF